MKQINSRQKGKRVEREAARFLRSLGFDSAARGAQHSGAPDSPDVKCGELSNIHFEVKGNKGIDVGTLLLKQAHAQAVEDSGSKKPVVLWKLPRKQWRLTFTYGDNGVLFTVGQDDIAGVLVRMNTFHEEENHEQGHV